MGPLPFERRNREGVVLKDAEESLGPARTGTVKASRIAGEAVLSGEARRGIWKAWAREVKSEVCGIMF